MSHQQTAIKTTYFSIAGNSVLAITKMCAGIFGNSYALIADAIESTTDIFSSLLVLLGLKYSNRPADKNHPYGHGRIEPLVTFIVVAFLISSALFIAHESVKNIQTPHKLPEKWTLLVLGSIIVWKEISYRLVLLKSKKIKSTVLKAEAWHHRSDAITSVAAFVGISVAVFLGEGYEAADDWAALLASGFILYNSYLILRPALSEIMDEHLYDDLVEEIRQIAKTVDGVIDTEKCFVRKIGLKFYIDLHISVQHNLTVKQGHDIAHALKDALKENILNIAEVLIHVEPNE
ncbi:MAG: cation diffusion facilitator family transporter [Bacteroidia bacterium]